MSVVDEIDWSQISLEQGMTRDMVIRAYTEAVKDLQHLNREYNRFFSGKRKQATHKMFTTNIFDVVQTHVAYNHLDQIDVSQMLHYIAADDRTLFSDITMFVYQFFHEKPKSTLVLNRFKGLFVYYLCKAGF